MQKYRVLMHGRNLLAEVDGTRQKFGFFTNVYLEALTEADAAQCAIEILSEDSDLSDRVLNADDDPLQLSADKIHEIQSFDGCRIPRDAFILYPADGQRL